MNPNHLGRGRGGLVTKETAGFEDLLHAGGVKRVTCRVHLSLIDGLLDYAPSP